MREIESHADDPIAVVEGKVRAGDRRGRELGFPTANVHGPDTVRLDGVYVGVLQLEPADGGPSYVTAVSVGHRPTYYGPDALRLLEAHILDFDGDIYGKHVRIELRSRLRPQRKYVDDRTLVRQLRLDVEATRSWAVAAGLEHLLAQCAPTSITPATFTGRATRNSPVVRRKRRKGVAKSAERQALREQQISRAIEDRDTDERLSPEWLARRVGLPVDYARWYLGLLEEHSRAT